MQALLQMQSNCATEEYLTARNDAMTRPATEKPQFRVHMQLSHAGPGLVRSLHTRQKFGPTLPSINEGKKIPLLIAESDAWPF